MLKLGRIYNNGNLTHRFITWQWQLRINWTYFMLHETQVSINTVKRRCQPQKLGSRWYFIWSSSSCSIRYDRMSRAFSAVPTLNTIFDTSTNITKIATNHLPSISALPSLIFLLINVKLTWKHLYQHSDN